ncbi:hypothetical protein [Roseiflexus castenholzii]|uniref:hypothetical protein n=1 Tax=Roseiflexus castenholzii TaxID=120962 RepID=UPI000319ABEF|nr:hypothetical protein [Roseiflexus castenholzii]
MTRASGRVRADCYVFDARGQYRTVPPDDDCIYRLTVLPGFWFDVAWCSVPIRIRSPHRGELRGLNG